MGVDPRSFLSGPSDLAGFKIHPIFRRESFRLHFGHLPPSALAENTFDFPVKLYQRTEPALRLASLFLEMVMPDLARIRYAPVLVQTSPSGESERVLSNAWSPTDETLYQFDQELLRMSSSYRYTMINPADRVSSHNRGDFAFTRAIADNEHHAPSCAVFVQTAIATDWLYFLLKDDWEAQSALEKCGRYFLLATTLVHELAHAVWCRRMIPLLEIEYFQTGRLTIDQPEPKFVSTDGFRELGYAIELQIFGGLPALPHFGTPMTAENTCCGGDYRILLSQIDIHGRTIGISQMASRTILSFFDPETWAPLRNGQLPNILRDLRLNFRPPRRAMSTVLSNPPMLLQSDVPILIMPDPGMLGPAITDANELF